MTSHRPGVAPIAKAGADRSAPALIVQAAEVSGAWPNARPTSSPSSRPRVRCSSSRTYRRPRSRRSPPPRFRPSVPTPAGVMRGLGNVAIRRVLGVGRPDRVLVVVEQERATDSRSADSTQGLNWSGSINKRREGLAGLRILGEVENQNWEAEVQFPRLAVQTGRQMGMVHVLGDCGASFLAVTYTEMPFTVRWS